MSYYEGYLFKPWHYVKVKGTYLPDELQKYAGRVAEVCSEMKGRLTYKLDIDNCKHEWKEEWLEAFDGDVTNRSKYNLGDVVIVRDDIEQCLDFDSGWYFDQRMVKYKGLRVVITHICDCKTYVSYGIKKEDNGFYIGYSWREEWLDPADNKCSSIASTSQID